MGYILTHYYTAIHLRDAADRRLTPNYRGVPLSIDWHTPQNEVPMFYEDRDYPGTVEIQNTGVFAWIGAGQFALKARWDKPIRQGAAQSSTVAAETNLFIITQPVTPGGSISGTFTIRPPMSGTGYILHFEMRQLEDDWISFDDLEDDRPWPPYDFSVSILRPTAVPVFLPVVLNARKAGPPPSLLQP